MKETKQGGDLNQNAEETYSPLDELDACADTFIRSTMLGILNLIKLMVIYMSKLTALVLTGVLLGVTLPAVAVDSEDSVVTEEHEEQGGVKKFFSNSINKVVEIGGDIKDRGQSAIKGVFSTDEKLIRAQERIDSLIYENSELRRDLNSAYINTAIDHQVAQQCASDVYEYLLKIGEQNSKGGK